MRRSKVGLTVGVAQMKRRSSTEMTVKAALIAPEFGSVGSVMTRKSSIQLKSVEDMVPCFHGVIFKWGRRISKDLVQALVHPEDPLGDRPKIH